MLPRLHVVTNDAVLARIDFEARATAVLAAGGADVALHVRGHATPAVRMYALATALRDACSAHRARLFVNDRVDIALACDADGLQLGRASLPVPDARTLFGAQGTVGYSAHGADEAASAVAAGADFVVVGSIWASPSHPHAPPAGLALVRTTVRDAGAPVIAIGGVTPAHVAGVVEAGAWGAAVLGGVWDAEDAGAAAARYLDAFAAAGGEPRRGIDE